jgi:hypothetical protein
MAKSSTATSTSYDLFIRDHRSQFDQLQIPEQLLLDLHKQLLVTYSSSDNDTFDLELSMLSVQDQLNSKHEWVNHISEYYGSLIVLPHAVSWGMKCGRGIIESLQNTDENALLLIWKGLQRLYATVSDLVILSDASLNMNQETNLVDAIADHPLLWSRVVLYRSVDGTVHGALPSPPFLPQIGLAFNDTASGLVMGNIDADCTGPFPFRYLHPTLNRIIDLSLLYVSPAGVIKMQEASMQGKSFQPTIDLVPYYQYPNDCRSRVVRYAALLHATRVLHLCRVKSYVREIYATFVHQMHLVQQHAVESRRQDQFLLKTVNLDIPTEHAPDIPIIYKVFTDSHDPMLLKHAVAGLEANSTHFQIVHDIETADIIFSYQSVFSPKHPFYAHLQDNLNIMINQFPYEGALVQKDHLAREVLKQHGLPRPCWALETYDLDVHFSEMVGSVLFAIDEIRSGSDSSSSLQLPLWIIKPALGTQSQGHVVTSSLAHILHLNDAFGGRRVAQRYIEHPLCIDCRKVDCRVIVLMTSAGKLDENGERVQLPILFMHKICYFRVANKPHVISGPSNRLDCEVVSHISG